MKYLVLIAAEESALAGGEPEEAAAITAEYFAWMQTMSEKGALLGGERLMPATDATTVRVKDGEVVTIDGPYAETKEQLGGYFVIECADLDEAIASVAGLPAATFGSIEVRPIWEM